MASLIRTNIHGWPYGYARQFAYVEDHPKVAKTRHIRRVDNLFAKCVAPSPTPSSAFPAASPPSPGFTTPTPVTIAGWRSADTRACLRSRVLGAVAVHAARQDATVHGQPRLERRGDRAQHHVEYAFRTTKYSYSVAYAIPLDSLRGHDLWLVWRDKEFQGFLARGRGCGWWLCGVPLDGMRSESLGSCERWAGSGPLRLDARRAGPARRPLLG